MPTSRGRNNQVVKQVGEYLVACELARRGLIVATFAGNVPDYDLIATDLKGASCPIQVKTVRGGSWQFSIDKFVDISLKGKRQVVGKKKRLSVPQLICVFVLAAENYGQDQFYVLKWSKVRDLLISHHKRMLKSHGGVRPKKSNSMHCAIPEQNLRRYKDNWDLILESFG